MDDCPEAPLPLLYGPWLREIVGGPIPKETVATCNQCVMLPPEGAAPGPEFFLPDVRCCGYQPTIPNFLAGRILSDQDPGIAHGRAALEERIARRVGVVPSGVTSSGVFQLLYSRTHDVFGRAPSFKCPYLTGDACGVWVHRPGVCATWYCKHVRGEMGFRFWKLTGRLLGMVEADLALWCAAEMGAGFSTLARLERDASDQPNVAELGGTDDPALYRELWGEWEGREKELYLASAKLVEPLEWSGVLAICGPQVRILGALVRDAGRHLGSDAIPERLRLGSFGLMHGAGGKIQVRSYSDYDPLIVPEGLIDALRAFDGRPTEEALAAILAERNLKVTPGLVRRLVDFGILRASE